MEINIKYNDIIDRCEKLSSFESQGRFDANGESRYLEIHINEVDKLLIQQYIEQARDLIGEKIARMISSIEYRNFDGYEKVELPEDRPFFSFKQYLTSSSQSIVDIAGLVEATPPPNAAFSDRYFLDSRGIFVIHNETDRKYYSHPDAVGLGYIYDPDNEKLYIDENGKKYQWGSRGFADYTPKYNLVPKYTDNGFTWSIRTDTRWNGIKSFTKYVTEAIVAYVMAAWLKGRLDDRVPFYEALHANTLNMAIKNVFTKQAPTYE